MKRVLSRCALAAGVLLTQPTFAAEREAPGAIDDASERVALADLPPLLASILSDARIEAERQAAALPDADARADAWGNLGMLYHAQRLRYLAQDAYDRALVEADKPRWRYLRAIVLSERGEIEASVADFRSTVAAQPDNPAAWYRLGVALFLTGELLAADAALRESLEQTPDAAVVLAARADVATAQGDPKQALQLYERAWELEPEAGQLTYKLAMVHRRLGNTAAARSWLERQPGNRLAPKIDDPLLLEVAQLSRTSRFYEIAADWALARGDHAQALDALRNAAAFAPEDPAIGLRFASLLGANGHQTESIAEVRRILAIDAQSAAGWYLLAWLLRTSTHPGDASAALIAVRRSLVLEENTKTRSLAAALSMRDMRFAEAMDHYERLIDRDAENAVYHYWLGLARLGVGDCRGQRSLEQALQLRNGWGEAHLILARAEALCGAVDAARRRSRALLDAKDDVDTRLTLALVELAAGRSEESRRLAEAQLPHPDAVMLLEALESGTLPEPFRPFAQGSSWWSPPEVR